MVLLSFSDIYFFITPILLLIFTWLVFFKLNISCNYSSNTNICTLKTNSNAVFINISLYNILLFYTCFYFIRGTNSTTWFNHFNINNFTLSVVYLFIFVSYFLYFLLLSLSKKSNVFKSIDYLFSISNLIVILPCLFLVNTIFTFLFLLELISVILLFKLISSKIWFKGGANNNLNNNIPQNYINMVFFQYWVTFFSTIFIVYFYINVYYIFGTSDFYLIQYLFCCDQTQPNIINIYRFIISVFIFSIFFKLGLTPFHLFKVEVYKGIPYLSIFFYTTYYFCIFFIFFLYFFSDFLGAFVSQYYLLLLLLLLLGFLHVIVLLFDVSFLKVFFTYSTIINTVGFITAFLCSIY